jgi:hypothetical protein
MDIDFPELETLTFEVVEDTVGILRINRPDRMNSQTIRMFSEYGEAADGSVSPRNLDSSLTDRFASFEWDGVAGSGVFEFALSRSPQYAYRPSC